MTPHNVIKWAHILRVVEIRLFLHSTVWFCSFNEACIIEGSKHCSFEMFEIKNTTMIDKAHLQNLTVPFNPQMSKTTS